MLISKLLFDFLILKRLQKSTNQPITNCQPFKVDQTWKSKTWKRMLLFNYKALVTLILFSNQDQFKFEILILKFLNYFLKLSELIFILEALLSRNNLSLMTTLKFWKDLSWELYQVSLSCFYISLGGQKKSEAISQ